MRDYIRNLQTLRFRFVTVLVALLAFLFAAENLIFQQATLNAIQKAANDSAGQLLVLETASATVVAAKDEKSELLSDLDWREHYPGLYDTMNSMMPWHWLGSIGTLLVIFVATAAIVLLSDIPIMQKLWPYIRIAVVLITAFGLAVSFESLWAGAIIVVLAIGLAFRDRSLSFFASIIMTIAFFTLLNNWMVASSWSKLNMQARLSEQFTLRENFLDTFGRRRLPEGNTDWFTSSAKYYLDSAGYVDEGLDLLAPLPEDSASTNDTEVKSISRLREWLDKSDAEILEAYQEKYGFAFRIIPRSANRITGIRAGNSPAFPSDQLRSPSIKTPSTEEIERQIESFVGPSEAGSKRVGIPLFAVMLSKSMERIQTDPIVVASRRINGPIQFLTLMPCIFCVLTMGLRWRNNIDVPDIQRREHIKWITKFGELNPVRIGIAKNHISKEQDPCGQMLFAAFTAFQSNFNQTDSATQVREIAESRINNMVSEYNMFRYVAWVIPSIGFVGTVLGIGDALLRADKLADPSADTSAALQAVIGELGVAFDTTLVALLTSILLMFIFHRLQRREEAVVLESQDQCLAQVVRNLTSKPAQLIDAQIRVKNGTTTKTVDIIDLEGIGSMDGPFETDRAYLVVRIKTDGTSRGSVHEVRLAQLLPDSRRRMIQQVYGTHSVSDVELEHASRRSHMAVAHWFEVQPAEETVGDGQSWDDLARYHRSHAESGDVEAVDSPSCEESEENPPPAAE